MIYHDGEKGCIDDEDAKALTTKPTTARLVICFDGPPGPEAGRFIEVEDGNGHSIRAGEWRESERYAGQWELDLTAELTAAEAAVREDAKKCHRCGTVTDSEPTCLPCHEKQVMRLVGERITAAREERDREWMQEIHKVREEERAIGPCGKHPVACLVGGDWPTPATCLACTREQRAVGEAFQRGVVVGKGDAHQLAMEAARDIADAIERGERGEGCLRGDHHWVGESPILGGYPL